MEVNSGSHRKFQEGTLKKKKCDYQNFGKINRKIKLDRDSVVSKWYKSEENVIF